MRIFSRLVAMAAVGIAMNASVVALGAAEIIYTNHSPANHGDNTWVMKGFFDDVAAATNGALTGRIMGGGVLASGNEALNALSSGVVDSAFLIFNYTPSDLPALTLVGDLSLYPESSRVAVAATAETILTGCPQCTTEMEKNNFVMLSTGSTEPYRLLCRNAAIESLADMAGTRVRGTGAMAQIVSALGGTPVNLQFSETYEAMERGSIDCQASSVEVIESNGFEELITDITNVNLGTFHGMSSISMNKDYFAALSEEDKAALIAAAAKATAVYPLAYETRMAVAETMAQDAGVVWREPSADLVAAIEAYKVESDARLIQQATERGVTDAGAIIATFKSSVDKWQAIVDEIGTGTWGEAEWQAYSDRVKSEIYDQATF